MAKESKLFKSEIQTILSERIEDKKNIAKLEEQIIKGAAGGLEFEELDDKWVKRFRYHFVWLDRDDYTRALVRALWLAPKFAGTDFGGSRQRDMGQVWTDTARGFLGEIAISRFLKERFEIDVELERRRGELKDFLSTDIIRIRLPKEDWREPRLTVSVKTTKFNGRWLDAPGGQIEHSDVFVLIKLGIQRDHFLAFLKAISFLKDKLFPSAKELGELSDENAKLLWDEIPQFEVIPAYIAGFIAKSELNLPIHMLNVKLKGRTDIRLAVTQGVGLFSPQVLREHPKFQELDPEGRLRIEIEPIISSYSGTKFLAHSGSLKFGEESWRALIESM